MLFSYNWLQDYIKERLPKLEKLAELLTLHSFEAAFLKKSGKDWVLDIDVLPNRAPDCFSHIGIARECSALTNSKFQIPNSKLKEDKSSKTKDFIAVEVRDKIDCPRYTARIVADVKVGPSPKWMQERLEVCGLRSINNIVDIANYVMLETGQPLHAFDFEKISGVQNQKSKIKNQKSKLKIKNIIIRKAKKEEKITTLDDEKYNLDEDILVIADQKYPLAIAGVKGGKKAEIDKKTKIIVLESANFNPQVIRRGSRKIGLRTDASLRFEHGIDPNLTEFAVDRMAYLIQKITGGKIAQGLVDVYSQKVFPKRIKLDLEYVEKILGIKIPAAKIKNILKGLGFQLIEVQPQSMIPQSVVVGVPTRRLDISTPEDLIEEIGRIAGFEKIPAAFPIASLVPPKRNLDIFWEDVAKNILKEAGFTEIYNYSFFGEKEVKMFGYEKKDLIELENPISVEQKYLRLSLIPNLLKNVEKNARYASEIKIFELGKVFRGPKVEEKRMLTGVVTGDAFYQLKGIIDLLLNKLGISKIWYDEHKPTPAENKILTWHPKKCAEIKINGEGVGLLGEISPKILNQSKKVVLINKVVLFDIDFEKLSKFVSEEHEYRPISKFPAAVRDLAILVPLGTKVVEALNKINVAGGLLVRDVDLFDIYEGEELPRGKKNLAFHIIYQAEDRTLSPGEIDKIHQKIIKYLEKEPEWQVRR